MMIADARDSKSLYEDVFKVFYDWGKQISIHGIPTFNSELRDLLWKTGDGDRFFQNLEQQNLL
jgi:hypothetical protein